MTAASSVRPFGAWPSPITAAVVAAQGLRLGAVCVDGGDTYWIEARPVEGGRNVLVRRAPDGRVAEVTPAGFNVRTRVHEYGGGAYAVHDGTVFFSNFADQRLYRVDRPEQRDRSAAAPVPVPMTPEGRWCYADATIDAARGRLICVREDHTDQSREAVTTLVSVPLAGGVGAGDVLASGYDFYSTPRLSPDGAQLAWIAWRHPQMPWDGTELWLADVAADGTLRRQRCVAGGEAESIYQPGWSPDGTLMFVSDRDGWWRLYRLDGGGAGARVLPLLASPPPDTEFGRPQWILGTSCWAFEGPSRLVVSYTTRGRWCLGVVDLAAGTLRPVVPDLHPGEWLATTPGHVTLVAGSVASADVVVTVALDAGTARVLKTASDEIVASGFVSAPEAVEFPTARGLTAHAFYYPPRSEASQAAPDERPPLIVIGHGGPVAAARPTLDLKIQFWTSRGFAVADVNYGGSTGYGRDYRRRLNGEWGVVDVADLIAAARHFVAAGRADARRLIIRGGSAGGYTTLAALTMYPDVFTAGASYYGISDLEALLQDSHKFEARCLDILVGPYPATKDVYRARSPIHMVDRLSCPLILFQGLEDKVVPPAQSELMAAALRAKGRPVAYLAFDGEQHGFRKAETMIRSLEAELYFYGAVFGFTPADPIAPVPIDNL